MARSREKVKGRKERGSWVAMPHAILESPNWASLSPRGAKFLMDLYGQYKGKNNGDLCAAMTIMRKRGWTSNDQLQKALKELLAKGWIIITRKTGRLSKKPYLYAVTFQAIDECGDKLDCKPTAAAPGNWNKWQP